MGDTVARGVSRAVRHAFRSRREDQETGKSKGECAEQRQGKDEASAQPTASLIASLKRNIRRRQIINLYARLCDPSAARADAPGRSQSPPEPRSTHAANTWQQPSKRGRLIRILPVPSMTEDGKSGHATESNKRIPLPQWGIARPARPLPALWHRGRGGRFGRRIGRGRVGGHHDLPCIVLRHKRHRPALRDNIGLARTRRASLVPCKSEKERHD
jgi:hypothetical protein